MIAVLIAIAAFAIWLNLLFFRGKFWDVRVPETARIDVPPARIVAVIPARDEASSIGQTVSGLLRQNYAGELHVVVVDDQSADGTADIACAAALAADAPERVTVLSGQALPAGWTGKLWAVSQGIEFATTLAPDFVLLTDADIVHDPENLGILVARATIEQRDMVSQMVLLRCRSLAERFLIPAFVFFFFMLYPPRWAADRNKKLAAAAGGCVLIRPSALERIGGIQAIRGRLIDDCALADAVKSSGGSIRLDVTRTAHSIRDYETASEIWAMIARSAFTQLNYSTLNLIGALAGLAVTYLAPPLLVLFGHGAAQLIGAVAWLMMAMSFLPTLSLYGLAWPWAFTMPAISVFYGAATLGSAVNYWRGRGGQWKGRVQASKPG